MSLSPKQYTTKFSHQKTVISTILKTKKDIINIINNHLYIKDYSNKIIELLYQIDEYLNNINVDVIQQTELHKCLNQLLFSPDICIEMKEICLNLMEKISHNLRLELFTEENIVLLDREKYVNFKRNFDKKEFYIEMQKSIDLLNKKEQDASCSIKTNKKFSDEIKKMEMNMVIKPMRIIQREKNKESNRLIIDGKEDKNKRKKCLKRKENKKENEELIAKDNPNIKVISKGRGYNKNIIIEIKKLSLIKGENYDNINCIDNSKRKRKRIIFNVMTEEKRKYKRINKHCKSSIINKRKKNKKLQHKMKNVNITKRKLNQINNEDTSLVKFIDSNEHKNDLIKKEMKFKGRKLKRNSRIYKTNIPKNNLKKNNIKDLFTILEKKLEGITNQTVSDFTDDSLCFNTNNNKFTYLNKKTQREKKSFVQENTIDISSTRALRSITANPSTQKQLNDLFASYSKDTKLRKERKLIISEKSNHFKDKFLEVLQNQEICSFKPIAGFNLVLEQKSDESKIYNYNNNNLIHFNFNSHSPKTHPNHLIDVISNFSDNNSNSSPLDPLNFD